MIRNPFLIFKEWKIKNVKFLKIIFNSNLTKVLIVDSYEFSSTSSRQKATNPI